MISKPRGTSTSSFIKTAFLMALRKGFYLRTSQKEMLSALGYFLMFDTKGCLIAQ